MIQVKRLGHATFTTPDLERQIDYWTRVIGLQIVDRGNCALWDRPFAERALPRWEDVTGSTA